MQIEGSNNIKAVGGLPTADNRPKPQVSTGQQPQGNEAKVDLSPLSTSLGKAEAAIAAAPVVDQARVDEIRQAISEGRFKVDADRIADGLIDSVRQMLETQAGKS